MLQYLIILLDDTAPSFCHYPNRLTARRLMPLETLRAGIRFAMKENLNVQFVYPGYALPEEYAAAIEGIDHSKIVPAGILPAVSASADAVVEVLDGWAALETDTLRKEATYVLRTPKADFFLRHAALKDVLPRVARLNVVLTDVETFTEADFTAYKAALEAVAADVERMYADGLSPQLNLLTDRMMLDAMNNCDAGWRTLTLAPDGRFYVCPAFYQSDEAGSVGSLADGVDVKNPQLYRLDHAPLCRRCDAWQCKRCVWLNRRTTLEVNTPGHEQCVAAHLERNASRGLLAAIRRHGAFLPERGEIKEISYLDPFDVREEL